MWHIQLLRCVPSWWIVELNPPCGLLLSLVKVSNLMQVSSLAIQCRCQMQTTCCIMLWVVFTIGSIGTVTLLSLRTRCDRFVAVCVWKNQSLQSLALKKSFEALFKSTCPTLAPSRWGYLFEVLAWLMPRQSALKLLAHDPLKAEDAQDFKTDECALLTELTQDGYECKKFWATCGMLYELTKWGANLSAFFHSCPVHGFVPGKPTGWLLCCRKAYSWMIIHKHCWMYHWVLQQISWTA